MEHTWWKVGALVLAAAWAGVGCGDSAVPSGVGVQVDVGVPLDIGGGSDLAVSFDLAVRDLVAADLAPVDLTSSDLALADGAAADLVRIDSAMAAIDAAPMQCPPGFGDCNRNPGDGCEANLGTDATNCGVCGLVCAPMCGKPGSCLNGQCRLAPCVCGFEDCDKLPANGCETNVNNDPKNCGACGNLCAQGKACKAGSCV